MRQRLKPYTDAHNQVLWRDKCCLPCTYLAPHEPKSIIVIVVIVVISIIINIIIKINVGADELLDHCRKAISSDRI